MAATTVTNNSPTAGSIAWTAFTIAYGGKAFPIAAGSTAAKYVWWKYNTGANPGLTGAPQLLASDTFPAMTPDDTILFLNKGGIGLFLPTATIVDGALIVPESIYAPAIAADQIETKHLAVGAVEAENIGAGAVTTKSLSVGSVSDNLVANGSFEDFAAGTLEGWTASASTGGTIVPVTGVSSSGAVSVQFDATTTTAQLRLRQDPTKLIPVSNAGGRRWYFSARMGASVATTKGASLRVLWFDANRAPLAAPNAFSDVILDRALATTFDVFDGQATPPDAARYAAVEVGINAPNVATKLYVDEVIAYQVLVSARIGDGQITAPKITASEELWAKIGEFAKVNAGHIQTGALDGKLITGAIIRTSPSGARVQIDQNGLFVYDDAGLEIVRLNGTSNQLTGRIGTNAPGEPGIILVPTTTSGKPGLWFSSTGTTPGTDSAIYADSNWNLVLRGKTDNGTVNPNGVIIQGGLQIQNGSVGTVAAGWTIDQAGWAIFKDVWTSEAVIGQGVFGDKHLAFTRNFAGFYFRLGGGAPAGADAAIYDSGTDQPLYIRSSLRGDGVRSGFRFMGGPLEYYDPPTSTFGANIGISGNPKDRLYKLTSARKYKYAIESFPAEQTPAILTLEPRTWFDSFQTDAYADYVAGGEGNLEDIAPLRRIPGLVAEEVEAAGLGAYCTYGADGTLEGISYDRLWTLLIPVVAGLKKEIEDLRKGLPWNSSSNPKPSTSTK